MSVRHPAFRRVLLALFPVLALLLAVTSPATAQAPGARTLGVALSNNSLIVFDTANPAAAAAPVAVTGINAGDNLVAIDFRPQNGFLYGIGFGSVAGGVHLYSISYRTGQATQIGLPATFDTPIVGTNFGLDFNPTVDRVRVVTDAGQNFRLNPNTGEAVDGNGGVAGIQMDGAISGATMTVDGTAYTNNQQNATVTTLYTLSAATDQLFIQNPPNNGTQTVPVNVTANGAPLNFTAANGFDIPPGVNVAASNQVAMGKGFAALTVGGVTRFYTIDLTSGAAISYGPIGAGTSPIQGLAVLADQVQVTGGRPAIGLSADGSQLLRFNTAAAATVVTVPITGITPSELVVGIDWRPQTGQLFALGVNAAADTATVYILDPQTGVATAVGVPGSIAGVGDLPLAAAGYGVDFNPTVDRIRVVTNTGLNFRVNPNTGLLAGFDVAINGLPPGATGVSGAAYTNSFGQSLAGGVTTQYVLEPMSNMLFIQNPPNAGVLTMGRAVTVDFDAVNGFDIPAAIRVTASGTAATGPAIAALTVGGGITQLYRIELGTGVAAAISPVGPGSVLSGLTVGDSHELTGLASGDADTDGLDDAFETSFGLSTATGVGNDGANGDPDGDGLTNLQEFQAGTHPRGFAKRFLAEGAATAFFDTRVALANPNGAPAIVQVRLLRAGVPATSSLLTLLPKQRQTINVDNLPGLSPALFSIVVESDAVIGVDRTMSWGGGYGSHAETGVAAPANTWFLAEGATGSNFNLFYLIQNPDLTTASQVRVRYLREFAAPLERIYTVAPNSRFTIFVDEQELPEGSGQKPLTSALVAGVFEVVSGAPIIVERAMYLNTPGQIFGAGHGSAAVPAPALNWFLAEGATGSFFDEFIALVNPNPTDAQVSIDYLLTTGTVLTKGYTVPANRKLTLWVDVEEIPAGSGQRPLAQTTLSARVRVTNNVPIVVERAMWFPGPSPANWAEAHATAGSTTTGTRWVFADGEVGGSQSTETFLLIANTGSVDGSVMVTLLFEDGTTASRTFLVAGTSRFTVSVREAFPQAVGQRFGSLVESTGASPVPLVVERAMYSAGLTAGTNVLGTKIQ
jgi:hypothetical protein